MIGVTRLARHSDRRGHFVAVSTGVDVPFTTRWVFGIDGNTDCCPADTIGDHDRFRALPAR